jgi:vitamin B12 transporter
LEYWEDRILKHRRVKIRIALALTVGTLLTTGQAWAAEDNLFQLEQVTVTAERIARTIGETPSNVTVISSQQLQDKGARTLADALSGVSGVSVQSTGSTGQIAVPYILGTERIVVLVDGKRMNLPQGMSYGRGGIDANTILLNDNIERIEVVRGGASTLYGADADGGVINIITKKGKDSTLTTASVAGGNYGARNYTLSTGGQEKNTHWLISGTQDSNDGQRLNSAYKSKNASFRIDQDLSKRETLAFTYDYYGSHAGLPGSMQYGPTLNDFGDILRRDWGVGYTKEHADGNRIFRYYDNNQLYSGENFGSFRHENTVRAFEYQDSAKLDASNQLTWGGEWRTNKVVSSGEGNISHEDTTKALYFQNQYSFNAASKLTLGLRQDNNSIYGVHLLPQAAYLYQANATTSYFANWSKVFRAPNFDELYSDDGYGDTGNPNLKPESGWTAEVGIKTRLSSANEATVSVFKRNLSDAIRWLMAPDFTYHPQNIDHYTGTGINANLTTKLSPATTAEFGYTYLDSRDQNGGNSGDPRNSFHIKLNMHDGKWSQSIYGIYQDQNGAVSNQVSSHFIVNTNTNFSLTKQASLFLTINNLFNKQYQAIKYYPADSRTVLFGIKQTL